VARPTTAERGYGHAHQKLRRREARKVAAGLAHCWRCLSEGKSEEEAWIAPDADWDLGHDDKDRSIYRGPEHAACNRRTSSRRTFLTRKRRAEKHPGLID